MESRDPLSSNESDTAMGRQDHVLAFATKMRQMRESKGISQASLAQLTRINLAFIEALEDGKFDRLPGHVFARGFIRNLCTAMNEPYAALIDAYDICFENAATKLTAVRPETGAKPLRKIQVSFGNPKIFARLKKVKPEIALAAIAVVALGIIVPRWLEDPQTVPKAIQKSSVEKSVASLNSAIPEKTVKPEMPAETVKIASPEALPESPVTEAKGPSSPPLAAAKVEQVIEIQVKDTVKVKMTMDNGETKVREFKPDLYKFTFAEAADLVVYDAAALSVSFNGRALGDLGTVGRIRRLSFRAADDSGDTL